VSILADWVPQEVTPDFLGAWRRMMGADVPPPQVFARGDVRVMLGREPVAEDGTDPRWHLSIASPDRVPSWAEIVNAAHALRPGVVFVIGVPPRSWWLNVHPNCLHLWEMRDANLAGQWRAERQGHEPS
jgi:hypothetical protein